MRVDRLKSKRAAASDINERATVKTGAVFIRSRMIERMPRSVQLAETQYESWVEESRYEFWMMVANADTKEIDRDLANLGWLFLPTDTVIEANAFGCDRSVLERALSRALQKAADQDINVVEIADITVDQDSCLSYVSILARTRELQKTEVLDSAGVEVCFSSREFEDESLTA